MVLADLSLRQVSLKFHLPDYEIHLPQICNLIIILQKINDYHRIFACPFEQVTLRIYLPQSKYYLPCTWAMLNFET